MRLWEVIWAGGAVIWDGGDGTASGIQMTLVGALIAEDRVYLGADRAQQRLDTESGCVWDYVPFQKLAQVRDAPLIWAYFGNTWIGERFRDFVERTSVPKRWRDFANVYGDELRSLNHRRDKGPYTEAIFAGRLEGRFNYLELSQDGFPLSSMGMMARSGPTVMA